MKCGQCGHKASMAVGTLFHRSHLPLRTWFRAMWWVTSQKHGMSALGLQRLLGLGSYKTAWSCLQKLRRAMVRPGRDRLAGEVEVDETYIGGVESGGVEDHLDYYLDKFTFQFNRRTSKRRVKLFFRLVEQAAATGPATFTHSSPGPNTIRRGKSSK